VDVGVVHGINEVPGVNAKYEIEYNGKKRGEVPPSYLTLGIWVYLARILYTFPFTLTKNTPFERRV